MLKFEYDKIKKSKVANQEKLEEKIDDKIWRFNKETSKNID
jgi:hypothetical protein